MCMTELLNLNHHKEDLNKKQTEAVTLSEESALVLAGAGSEIRLIAFLTFI